MNGLGGYSHHPALTRSGLGFLEAIRLRICREGMGVALGRKCWNGMGTGEARVIPCVRVCVCEGNILCDKSDPVLSFLTLTLQNGHSLEKQT